VAAHGTRHAAGAASRREAVVSWIGRVGRVRIVNRVLLTCVLIGMISQPGTGTAAWPARGRPRDNAGIHPPRRARGADMHEVVVDAREAAIGPAGACRRAAGRSRRIGRAVARRAPDPGAPGATAARSPGRAPTALRHDRGPRVAVTPDRR
jgi:hypothetical protein